MRGIRWWRTLPLIAVLVSIAAAATLPSVNWRGRVVWAKALGNLTEMTWAELIPMLAPGHLPTLAGLVEQPNLHEVIRNPHESLADIAAGHRIFDSKCSQCHRDSADARRPGFSGADLIHGNSDWAIYRNIQRGIPRTGMPRFDLPEKTAWQLVAYARSLQAPNNTSPADSDPGVAFAETSYDRLLNTAGHPEEWLTYSGQYQGHRNSGLRSINRDNVGRLELRWKYKTFPATLSDETTPLVVGQVMYVTMPPARVLALNAITGRLIWSFERRVPAPRLPCCGNMNRGVAVLGSRVYFASADAHLIALEMTTGRVAWDVKMADSKRGYSSTAAPLAAKDLIITGISGGEMGICGFLDAYDAETGRRRRVVEDGWWSDMDDWVVRTHNQHHLLGRWKPGAKLQPRESQRGQSLYKFAGCPRCRQRTSGVVLQFTPNDVNDYDANQVPVLVDLPWRVRSRKLVLTANKNGFFYLLDRTTGTFLAAVQLTRQNWAKVAENGLPLAVPVIDNSPVRVVYPSNTGAANWFPASFNPGTNLFYVPVLEQGVVITRQQQTYFAGRPYFGGVETSIRKGRWSALIALDPLRAKVLWQVRDSTGIGRLFGGTLATDGGLIFWGHGTTIAAFDAKSERSLWHFNAGEPIRSAPMTYSIGGRQRIVITAGGSVMAFELRK